MVLNHRATCSAADPTYSHHDSPMSAAPSASLPLVRCNPAKHRPRPKRTVVTLHLRERDNRLVQGHPPVNKAHFSNTRCPKRINQNLRKSAWMLCSRRRVQCMIQQIAGRIFNRSNRLELEKVASPPRKLHPTDSCVTCPHPYLSPIRRKDHLQYHRP